MLVFDLMYAHFRGYDAPWVGDPKKKTWSWSIDAKDPTKTCEMYYKYDPERPHLNCPVRVIRSKPTRPDWQAEFQSTSSTTHVDF